MYDSGGLLALSVTPNAHQRSSTCVT